MAADPPPGSLSQRASQLVEQTLGRSVIPLYFRATLTLDEQVRQRGKPLPYLVILTRLVAEYGFKTIVEIGSVRQPMRHAMNAFDPVCCNDGHSTFFLAATGADVFTVDVDPACAVFLEAAKSEYPNLNAFTGDGITFLKDFDHEIEILFLDAWDVIAGTDYAEKHLEAYRIALPKLAKRCLVQIDDTDILNGGKGRLVIPQMIRDGFDLVTWGRQAILVRG